MDEVLQEAKKFSKIYRISFYMWSSIYHLSCVLMIILPLIIASELAPESWHKILALSAAVISAAITWSKLSSIVRNFSQAFTTLELAITRFHLDADRTALMNSLEKARAMVLDGIQDPPTAK